jgi:hypothetical protein
MYLGFDDLALTSGSTLFGLMTIVLAFQVSVTLYMIGKFQFANQERTRLYHQLFGILRKIEGLSSGRRALIAHNLDILLEQLAKQLPSRIAAEAGEIIYKTESSMLKALADLEPNLPQMPGMKERVEKLVVSMESLESTVVLLTTETVRQAILDTKRSILDADSHEDR